MIRKSSRVVICFQISTFVGSSTGSEWNGIVCCQLWFAFKLVPLLGHQQEKNEYYQFQLVVICFQISTFVGSSTGSRTSMNTTITLWFAFKLVPLLGHQQEDQEPKKQARVVICFQISTFVGSSTGVVITTKPDILLWFAFKLVPLLGHQQETTRGKNNESVVICFQISTFVGSSTGHNIVWRLILCCDLLSN